MTVYSWGMNRVTYVVKGTPPGYDIGTAADYLLSFNSSWPLPKLHETGNFSGTVTHGLGYPPFHLLARPAGGVGTADGRVDQFADEYGVNSTVLSRFSGSGTPRYFIFRLDLTTDFTAPIETGSTTQNAQNDDYVFKMTKPGEDTSSTDMRDFALHSNTRSPALHKVAHGSMSVDAGGWIATIPHGLSYVPTAFAFIKPNANSAGLDPDKYTIVPPPVGVGVFYYLVDATSVTLFADGSLLNLAVPEYSVVVLKDPFTKDIINVSFP